MAGSDVEASSGARRKAKPVILAGCIDCDPRDPRVDPAARAYFRRTGYARGYIWHFDTREELDEWLKNHASDADHHTWWTLAVDSTASPVSYSDRHGGDAAEEDDVDYGSPKKTGMNACTSQYSPHSGGVSGSEIESAGGEGPVAGVELGPLPTDASGMGNYANASNNFGDYPHSPADPEVGGAPIGSTPADPTRSMY